MENEVKKSYNPFKTWGFWIGFIIGFSIVLFSVIKPFGCNPQYASWSNGVYFGIESFMAGSSNCTDFVTPKYQFCSTAMSYHKGITIEKCLENPNQYSFKSSAKSGIVDITVDNIEYEFSSYGGDRIFKVYWLLFYLYGVSIWGLIPAFIFGSIGWGIHSLIRKYKK